MSEQPKIENKNQEGEITSMEEAKKLITSIKDSLDDLGKEGYPEPQGIRLVGRNGVAHAAKKHSRY